MTQRDKTVPAFVFDIDGVLVKGRKPVPGARETIQLLQRLGIPFIFLTNGGGHTEAAHVAKLAMRIDVQLDAQQFVQSHTPFYDLVPKYEDETVLVLGGSGQQIRELAQAYGFRKVVTSSDLLAQFPHIHPFPEMTGAHHAEHARINDLTRVSGTRIAAILVWTSPRDWCLDLQVVMDLLLSEGGVLGTRSRHNGDTTRENKGYQTDGQPPLFFCNPDFEWSTEHTQPRFAQGAFREALKGVWQSATGGADLEYSVVGKPTEATYIYGERTLREYADKVLPEDHKIGTAYMIGDNPQSDIIGSNSFVSRAGITWKSVLVETGVYVAGTTPSAPPFHTARNVKEAIEWALEREGVDTDATPQSTE
ncbi:HAD-superfamily hydrolase [Hypomontagnella monticulosa]|nr:HAD-superfamily hydrolase [Hypomontagnella monticulosa]